MESTQAVSLLTPPPPTTQPSTVGELGSDDFLSLLITQLQNQDPLEPMGNEELLNQLSSVREIELSTSITDALKSLTGNQQFSSASTLIGRFVSSAPDEAGVVQSGQVTGVRFDADGQPVLRLASGTDLPLNRVATIESPAQVAESLIGKSVTGLDRRDPTNPTVVEGLVTAVNVDSVGEVLLELDTGQNLRFRDVVSATSPN